MLGKGGRGNSESELWTSVLLRDYRAVGANGIRK